ncbi:polysaccharide pyruvyl transferase family protein [Rubrimonas cliftonensis]|uniref:Polysaccharide pyruvyl transferase n=1 Tax=Rubrimonas cliftonensis TaxID=89524 RepID=A0A1H4CZ70_9RHOB|nr:polysaccharide pyruvyl transferase family protein [Rubrimonas cliftonensis]SEA65342.1 Polysaccharide pyruvyl transferase [Rubrimonas cliftonensis]
MPDMFAECAAAPLAWVRAQPGPPPYVNVGDALSPFLLTMVSGRPAAAADFVSDAPRIAAIGTIAQNFAGGRVEVWGAGCSPWSDPLSPRRRPFVPPAGTEFRLHATRGPLSARLLSGGGAPDVPFGDPAALLPRFYAAPVEKRWELGVVLHLSELADRGFEAVAKPAIARYAAPADGSVRLITMVAPPTVAATRDKIDEIRACRRIVSTSLHGLAIAAAYGVPCLYLGADRGAEGVAAADLTAPDAIGRVNARFVDLLLGCGQSEIVYWRQRKGRPTDWDALMRAVDAEARPLGVDGDALIDACPAGAAPLAAPAGGTIWDHPLIAAAPFDAAAAPAEDAEGAAAPRAGQGAGQGAVQGAGRRLVRWFGGRA